MEFQNALRSKLFIVLGLAMFSLTLPLIAAAQEKIAFCSARDGNPEIYVMNPDGTNQTRLTSNAAGDAEPSFSPDGSKIAFISNRTGNVEIYVMDADGSNQTNVTNNASGNFQPSFSPDGSKITFISNRDGSVEIYVMNADGSNPRRLTYSSWDETNPSFSPDSSKIAFTDYREPINPEIYVMDAFGFNQVNLTNEPGFDGEPSFSPDGSKITFISGRTGNYEIYVMNADGSNQINVSNNASLDYSPSFSPGGSKIAFASFRDSNYEIYVMNADGSNQNRLTNNPASDENPSWGGLPPAPPTLSNVAVTSSIDENGTAMLSGNIGDPNSGDNFTLTVNWGDGTAPQVFNYPAGTTSFSKTHQYPDDNPTATAADNYTITLLLDDNGGGGSDTASTVVTVNNVAPLLSGVAVSPATMNAGASTMLSGLVGDVGAQDSHTIHINWGDGSNTTLNLPAAGVSAFSASHQYHQPGNFTIGIMASDDDSGAVSDRASLTVNTTVPPNAPSGLTATAISASQINLAWTDNSNSESGFVIEQCRNKNCNNFVLVGQVGANVTTFPDTGLLNNTHYIYRVRAVNNIGNSPYSNTATAKTLHR